MLTIKIASLDMLDSICYDNVVALKNQQEEAAMGSEIRCAYSIHYYVGFDGTLSLDWDYWNWPREWSVSFRSYCGSTWSPLGRMIELDIAAENLGKQEIEFAQIHPEVSAVQEAYDVLLESFGLFQWREEFPLERVAKMSPAELLAERQKKEAQFGLPRHEAISNTAGSHLPAEEYN